MKTFVVTVICMAFASIASAECRTAPGGRKVCGNGENAATYNPRTGNAATSKENSNGVKETQTSRGGQAKTKNGKGVYQAPNGTTCVKGRHTQGCQ